MTTQIIDKILCECFIHYSERFVRKNEGIERSI